ncbi:Transposase IS200 like protein [Planctomycetes bacterium Poly30]|uniref:Transposase IS200 like protein n=1 Tax=Saltatorellus ferox TaxID=2528018 RepID=A0A518EVT8_9BACT|nr:Transposase IS200 like protein [Planctomycetes bacterium Poly30]
MPRRRRIDFPGAFHHVTNRGIAKRVLMEDREDARYLSSCIARETRRGKMAIHCFSLLPTHFHLLTQTVEASLSESMQRIEGRYGRYFNRKYRRDGPLFRGRFFSKRVDTLTYRRTLLRYIDRNPVQAGLVKNPWDHPFGSAVSYVHGPEPPWLTTSWVKGEVTDANELEGIYESRVCSGSAYIDRFGRRSSDFLSGMVEARMNEA